MFALNKPYSGHIRGLRGADYECYRQSRRAGISIGRKTFRALLSSSTQDIKSIVPLPQDRNIPIVNKRDEILFDSWEQLFNGNGGFFNTSTPIYSFDGRNVRTSSRWPQKYVWHGSDKRGSMQSDFSCQGWHSGYRNSKGYASNLLEGKLVDTNTMSCDNKYVVLCIQNTSGGSKKRK
ncbi:collagen alpha-1(XV) chain-like [Argopecten irradians]|uniref:collagen alpha-1(XV) chain-like n=1 Tax=Argopecten irradians TaxID=31199 RepID=UPI0037148DEE